jgi:hypothetical protein
LQHANYLKYNANWGSIYYGDEALLKLGDAGSLSLEASGGDYTWIFHSGGF